MSRLIRQVLIVAACLAAVPAAAFAQRPNPSQAETDQFRRRGPCSDPWVTIAVIQVNAGVREPHGAGNVGECDITRYNGGRWSSFDELYRYVDLDRAFLRLQNLEFYSAAGPGGASRFVVMRQVSDRVVLGATLVGNDGSSLQFSFAQMVAAGAGNIVGQNGSGMVAAGGGNMVAAGAGNMVAAGGGNFRPPKR